MRPANRSDWDVLALVLAVPGVYLLTGVRIEGEALGIAFAFANAALFAAGHTESLPTRLGFVMRWTIWERVPVFVIGLAAFYLAVGPGLHYVAACFATPFFGPPTAEISQRTGA